MGVNVVMGYVVEETLLGVVFSDRGMVILEYGSCAMGTSWIQSFGE